MYRAGHARMVVGGDWYDAFELPDGRIGLVVGDVVGHGVEAAAAMGRLRTALAALALDEPSPAAALERLDAFARTLGATEFATACYAILEPVAGDLTYASAGHPPILLVGRDGTTRYLPDALSTPLSGLQAEPRPQERVQLAPGSTLVLYSDGVVERRGESITDGLTRLAAAAAELGERPVEECCRLLMDALVPAADARTDDSVILCARLDPLAADRATAAAGLAPEVVASIRGVRPPPR
jgi:serine phosphatase RsbU (regulator of sigma subunit)